MKNIVNYIKCGRQLNEHLVKKKISKFDVKPSGEITIPIFKCVNNTDELDLHKYETFTFDKDVKYVVYKDAYHETLHFADIEDMMLNLGINCDYFEDFSMDDIVAQFKTLKEGMIWMFNELGAVKHLSNILKKPKITEYEAETLADSFEKLNDNTFYDNATFIYDVLTNKITEKNYEKFDSKTFDIKTQLLDVYGDVLELPDTVYKRVVSDLNL